MKTCWLYSNVGIINKFYFLFIINIINKYIIIIIIDKMKLHYLGIPNIRLSTREIIIYYGE